MYKPPSNTNRVKTIKNKFENFDSDVTKPKIASKYGARNNLSPIKSDISKPPLSRQLSDPLKRNIKRTPAFRLEKSQDSATPFQRNVYANRSTTFESKVKQFHSALKNNCDSNSNVINGDKCKNNDKECNNITPHKNKLLVSDHRTKQPSSSSNMANKPILFKSKSSADFNYIRNKFSNPSKTDETVNTKEIIYQNQNRFKEAKSVEKLDNLIENKVDISMLYTEPIPKALRKKNCDIQDNIGKHDIYNISTLKISDKLPVTNVKNITLTDTLKSALKRPLPTGPAPKKPPRTFQHPQNNLEGNQSFLHTPKNTEIKLNIVQKTNPVRRSDPKYMLSKLENALKNNKLRARKQAKIELSTTSGEDSDDSLLFKSKSQRTLPKLPVDKESVVQKNPVFDLNCLNGFSCTQSNYEKLKEPMSSFFVDRKSEEPVYAEPFHDRNGEVVNQSSQIKRNSLYYMSSPVYSADEKMDSLLDGSSCNGEVYKPAPVEKLQLAADISSLSSFTSDTDSTYSTEETTPSKVRDIVEIFQKQQDTDRVENLRNKLNRTLERSFSTGTRSPDAANVKDIVQRFQHYIKQVPKYSEPKFTKSDPLFHCCLIVERSQDIAHIKYKFPPRVDVPGSIEKLVFPETHMVPIDSNSSAQSYSMVLTDDKAERMFGYCRRVIPEGSTTCLPLAYCILSKYRSPRFYKKVLIELETRHGYPDKVRDELISQFYEQPYPQPGGSIKVDLRSVLNPLSGNKENNNSHNINGLEESVDLTGYVNVNRTGEYGTINKRGEKVFVCDRDIKDNCMMPSIINQTDERIELELTLHPDRRYEVTDLTSLHKLPVNVILKVFSSLLLERKVILISSVLSDLSLTVDALQSILYPFVWPHTVIPVLPECLWPVVESPTPVICGCLSRDVLEEHSIENGIVVDLDKGSILKCEGDEEKILSSSMKKAWRKTLNLANFKKLAPNIEKLGHTVEYTRSKHLSDAYLQVFASCMSHYKNHISGFEFNAEEFIKAGKTKGIRKFLQLFTQTFMFNEFLRTRNSEKLSDFDRSLERITNK